MTTPTTTNPFVLLADEPPGWNDNGNKKSWEDHKRDVQIDNARWFAVRQEGGNYSHTHDTPLNIEGSGFPLGLGNRYGPFVYAPLPIDGVVRWGFQRKEGLEQFLTDLAKDELPKGGATPILPKTVRKEPVSKDIQTQAQVATIVAQRDGEDPFAGLDLGAAPEWNPEDPFAGLDTGSSEPPVDAPEPDPFADLDLGLDTAPEPSPAAPEPAPEPVADTGEPLTDEWGQIISAPASDPFADL